MRFIKIGLAAAMLLVFAVAPAASAQRMNSVAQMRTNIQQVREQAQARAEEARTSVEERRTAITAEVEQRRAAVRQAVCERRQATLEKVIPRLGQNAKSVQKALDTMYGRVTGFYENGQLTVDNYDELVSNIETAKANAATAVSTIDEFQFELDCNDPNLGEQLDSYRTAVKDARDALKEYRSALVELISSLRSAAATQEADGGSNG